MSAWGIPVPANSLVPRMQYAATISYTQCMWFWLWHLCECNLWVYMIENWQCLMPLGRATRCSRVWTCSSPNVLQSPKMWTPYLKRPPCRTLADMWMQLHLGNAMTWSFFIWLMICQPPSLIWRSMTWKTRCSKWGLTYWIGSLWTTCAQLPTAYIDIPHPSYCISPHYNVYIYIYQINLNVYRDRKKQ